MMQVRKILFPIVFCQTASALASSVKEMAQRFNASVIVLNASIRCRNMHMGQRLKPPVIQIRARSCSLRLSWSYAMNKSGPWKSSRTSFSQAHITRRGSSTAIRQQ